MSTVIPKYFFLNNELHKTEKIIKTQNWIVAFNFEKEERMQYSLSFVAKEFSYAFRTKEIQGLLKYPLKKILIYLDRKMVNGPSGRAYSIATKKPGAVYWSEEDLIELRQKLYDLVPKKNGYPSGQLNLVSHAELMSQMHRDAAYYIKDSNGNLMKVWKSFT